MRTNFYCTLRRPYPALLLASLIVLSAFMPVTNQATEQGSPLSKKGEYLEILDLNEFLQTTGQMDTPGYLVLLCGNDRKQENMCNEIRPHFENITKEFASFPQTAVFYNLTEGDTRLVQYFDIQSMPQFMYIKNRRVYYYRDKQVNNRLLGRFIQIVEQNPNYLYRRFPTGPISKLDYFMEGLYNTEDKIFMLVGGSTTAMYIVYSACVVLLLMLLYGIAMIIYEALTGNVYKNLAQREIPHEQARTNSEDLKVKKD